MIAAICQTLTVISFSLLTGCLSAILMITATNFLNRPKKTSALSQEEKHLKLRTKQGDHLPTE